MRRGGCIGKAEGLEERIRNWSATIGQGKEMAHAEAFRVLTIENDETWARLKAQGKEIKAE